MRGLFWYQSGRWQVNPVRRFLDHFVALEHLFAAGLSSKAENVAQGVATVFGSWMFRGFPFSAYLESTIQEARYLLAEAAAQNEITTAANAVATRADAGSTWPFWRVDLRPSRFFAAFC